jgi:hypothetical protein
MLPRQTGTPGPRFKIEFAVKRGLTYMFQYPVKQCLALHWIELIIIGKYNYKSIILQVQQSILTSVLAQCALYRQTLPSNQYGLQFPQL